MRIWDTVEYPELVASLPDHLSAAPVGKEKLPREVLTQHQRSRVLEAALNVFSDYGYPATTVDDIVAAAGIGVGSFYTLCDSKEGCLLAVYDRLIAEAKASVMDACAEFPVWEDKICAGIRRSLELVAEDPRRARLVLIEIQAAGGSAIARYDRTLAEAARCLTDGRRRIELSQQLPRSLEAVLTGCIAWLLNTKVSLGEAASTPTLFEEVAELVLEPYLGQERAVEAIARHAPGAA